MPRIEDIEQKLLTYKNRYKNALLKKLELINLRYQRCMASRVFKDPMQRINEQYMILDKIVKNLGYEIQSKLKDERTKMIKKVAKLDALSPLKTLTRGYTVTQYKGKVINSSKILKKGDEIELTFSDGKNNAKII